jgi:hypothetical protein
MQNVTFNCDGCGKEIEPAAAVPEGGDWREERKRVAYFEVNALSKFVYTNPVDQFGMLDQSHSAQGEGTQIAIEVCRQCAETLPLISLLQQAATRRNSRR